MVMFTDRAATITNLIFQLRSSSQCRRALLTRASALSLISPLPSSCAVVLPTHFSQC